MSNKERISSIEILKIIAIFLIIICHVTSNASKSLSVFNNISNLHVNYVIQKIILFCNQFFAAFGNNIFFICSAWFLVDSHNVKKRKVIHMILDVWIVSVLFLMAYLLLHVSISKKEILKSLLPNYGQNNWYITFYLIFYAIHPFLNICIDSMSRKQHRFFCLVASMMYLVIGVIEPGKFFSSELITFIVEYFDVAYMKRYLTNFQRNIRANMLLLFFSTFSLVTITVLGKKLGMNFGDPTREFISLSLNCNPFVFLDVICLFNIIKRYKFHSNPINRIASSSIYIYIYYTKIYYLKHTQGLIW